MKTKKKRPMKTFSLAIIAILSPSTSTFPRSLLRFDRLILKWWKRKVKAKNCEKFLWMGKFVEIFSWKKLIRWNCEMCRRHTLTLIIILWFSSPYERNQATACSLKLNLCHLFDVFIVVVPLNSYKQFAYLP